MVYSVIIRGTPVDRKAQQVASLPRKHCVRIVVYPVIIRGTPVDRKAQYVCSLPRKHCVRTVVYPVIIRGTPVVVRHNNYAVYDANIVCVP